MLEVSEREIFSHINIRPVLNGSGGVGVARVVVVVVVAVVVGVVAVVVGVVAVGLELNNFKFRIDCCA